MEKEQVLEKLTSYYEEEMKENQFYQQTMENQELIIKLIQTTNLFVRSFDYDLPKGHSMKAKINMFIHRLIRRSTRFITKPYADKMQIYNESICELLGQIINNFGEKNKSLAQEIELLNNKIKQIDDQEIELLNNKIKQIDERSNRYEREMEEKSSVINQNRLDIAKTVEKVDRNTNYISGLQELSNDIIGIKNVLNDTVNKTLEMGGQLTVLNQKNIEDEDAAWKSYSQAGEDRIVDFLLSYRKSNRLISYLDIGCNHYKNLNNTFGLYKKGYRGVLVEAVPKFIEEIKHNRPGDLVLNVGVGGEKKGSQIFYVVNGDGLSSFDKTTIENAKKETPWLEIVDEIEVPVLSINDIIENYCNGVPTFVTMDVEGLELDILQSLDFEKFRPFIFSVETIFYSNSLQINKKRVDIVEYMKRKGYEEYAFTGVNSIFVDINQLD